MPLNSLRFWGYTAVAALMLAGCGGGGGEESKTATGYLIDAPVINADYDCLADNEFNKSTGNGGSFSCRHMNRIRFRIGELILGEIDSLPEDGYVLPQDLLGVDRESSLEDPRVVALAQFLQSIDSDRDPSNGISVPQEIKESFYEEENFNPEALIDYLEQSGIDPESVVSPLQAQEHLRETLQSLSSVHLQPQSELISEQILALPAVDLSQELKDALAYMGNEERLAYDVYRTLYDTHKDKGTEIFQLYTIAEQSERTHAGIVQSLVRKYGLSPEDLTILENPVADSNVSFESMPSGSYGIPKIQELYDTLVAKGSAGENDALEVGCMVEVTDINDLDEYLEKAREEGAEDLALAFDALRSGSYNHYWAFDRGLKNRGVSDGCCALGEEYCHPEYPQNTGGQLLQ